MSGQWSFCLSLFTDNVSGKAAKVGTYESLSSSALPVGQGLWSQHCPFQGEQLKMLLFLMCFGNTPLGGGTADFTDSHILEIYKVSLQSALNKICHSPNAPHIDNVTLSFNIQWHCWIFKQYSQNQFCAALREQFYRSNITVRQGYKLFCFLQKKDCSL